MPSAPSGNITFLFTDIEGSTILSQKYPELLQGAIEIHNSILKESINSNKGFIFEIIGDAFCSAFENTEDAVKAAVEIQEKLQSVDWDEVNIKVRIGINSGEAVWDGNKYSGYITLAKSQRLMSAAHGGQIIISKEALDNVKVNVLGNINYKDLGERRLKNIIKPVHIFQILSGSLEEFFPPLKTLDRRHDNLPVRLTSFIGREEESENLRNMLASNRLITLKGMGGSGKTRLAVKIASESIDEFTDGVMFADLTSARNISLFTQLLESLFNAEENTDPGPYSNIIGSLKDKEMLLILDNCEQIIETCAGFAERALEQCPKLKIIATSREALNCAGEKIFEVRSLQLPETGKKISTARLSKFEAVRLFIERANLIDPDFRLKNANAETVAEICRNLDGIPLAIELAASRIKILSPEKINEKLNDRFKFLTGGIRTADSKNKTLKAMVEWSYDLLTEEEKLLWRRFSVFADGATLEAVENICSDNISYNEDILNLLTSLADKSLIIYSKKNERYSMLETIRQYGEEKLVESGELEKIILKHIDFYLKFAEPTVRELSGNRQREVIKKLESENSNFQLALTSSIIRNQKAKGIRLALYLCRYWEIRGYNSTAVRWLIEFMNNPGEIPENDKAQAILWLGTFEWVLGNFERSHKFYEESYEKSMKLGNKKGIAVALNNLGLITNVKGEFDKALEYAERSYSLCKEIGEKYLTTDALMNLGSVLVNLSKFEEAKKIFEECLKLYRELGDLRGIGMTLTNIGTILGQYEEFEPARILLEESMKIQRELGDKRGLSMALGNYGYVMSMLGFNQKAHQALEESISIHREHGDKKGLASSMNSLAFIKFNEGDTNSSIQLHRKSLKLQNEIGDMLGIIHSIAGTAESLNVMMPELSAMLIGFAEKQSAERKLDHDKQILSVLEKTKSILIRNIGVDRFNERSNKGKLMEPGEAVRMILTKDITQSGKQRNVRNTFNNSNNSNNLK